jgi:cysteinyl-tRNA synthetase
MSQKIYSSLTRKVEDFVPIKDKELKMYACGITVYDEAHLGHAAQAVIFDVIRNYFEFNGYKVTYVRNFTDIDDKIIDKANQKKVSINEITEKYIESTRSDLALLKCKPATIEPKATETIPEIIEFVSDLISKEYAYVVDGEVFFDTTKYKEYGKLSGRKLENMMSPDESTNKKSPQDFSLWKAAKPNEPSWDSPWGKGRPGWHIECSVMADKFLGHTIDIHGGGLDLVFPHHENEVAQSEARNNAKFANYWIHNGLIMVNGVKMSKSLGNFMTIKELLRDYHPDVIRYLIISHSYTSPIDFSLDLLKVSAKKVYSFYKTLYEINQIISNNTSNNTTNLDFIDTMISDFKDNMDNNFNTPAVFASINNYFTSINNTLKTVKVDSLKKFIQNFNQITSVFKILDENPSEFVNNFKNKFLQDKNISLDLINQKIKDRKIAKESKNYPLADEIRKELLDLGITLQDNSLDTNWDISL